MNHLPINHHLRSLWRTLAFFTGVYILVFGIVGYVRAQAAGLEMFAQEELPTALLLKANPAFALLSIVVGALVVIAVVIGRNVDFWVDLIAGTVFLLAGLLMLLLLRSDLNYLGFQVSTCVMSFVLGLILVTAGLYGRVGSVEAAAAEEAFRHDLRAETS